jgi:hypothetical protein
MTTAPDDKGEFITADQAIFETELAMHGLTDSGVLGKMEVGEAQKLAEILFADEEGLPDEIRHFFGFPEESS